MKLFTSFTLAFALVGCAAAEPLEISANNSYSYCDSWKTINWNSPDCRETSYAGMYGTDTKTICPQLSDGTDWDVRTYTVATGGTDTVYERYIPGNPPKMLCSVSAFTGNVLFQDPCVSNNSCSK